MIFVQSAVDVGLVASRRVPVGAMGPYDLDHLNSKLTDDR